MIDEKTRNGFTLLEVLVAVAIFSVASITVLAIRSNSYREWVVSKDYNVCRYLLQKKMEEILVDPTGFQDGDEGDFSDNDEFGDYNRFSWALEMEEVDLLGGDEGDDLFGDGEEDRDRDRDRDGNRNRDDRNDGGDDFLGGEDGEEEETLTVYRITLYINFFNFEEEKHISATTYVPADKVVDDEFF